jgi:hypothetical protein
MLTEKTQAPSSARTAAMVRARSEVGESFDRATAAVEKIIGEMDSAVEGAFDDALRAAQADGAELTEDLAELALDEAYGAAEEEFDARVKDLIRTVKDIDGRFVKRPSVDVTTVGPGDVAFDTGDFTLRWPSLRRAYGLV